MKTPSAPSLGVPASSSNPPGPPSNLSVTGTTATTASLSWTAAVATQYPIAQYNIFRNAQLVSATVGLTYTDTGLAALTTYTYTIQAQDSHSGVSANSNAVQATTPGTLAITTASPLPNATQNSAYSTTLAASGGTTPYTWSEVAQTGTNSWSISAGGVVTGTPSTAEGDTITAQVTDAFPSSVQKTFGLTVASVGTSLTNNVAFTVAGSGFGTKSGSAPTVYDDISAANLAAGPWTRARSFYTIASASADPWCENYRHPTDTTPNGDTWGATTGAVVPTATPFRTRYMCSAAMSANQGGYAASNLQFGYAWAGLAPPYYIVASWYEAFAPNWGFGSAYGYHGLGDNNNKWMILNNSTSGGSLSGIFWYMEWGNSQFTSATATPSVDIDDVSSGKVGIIPGGGEYHPAAVPNKFYTGINGWVKKEVSMFLTPTQSGFISLTISQPTIPSGGTLAGSPQTRNNVYLWNSSTPGSGVNGGVTDPYAAGSGRSFFIGGFKRNFPQARNRIFWSDIYLDMQTTGVGRFALTDTNSLSTATCCEWQPYTSWSNTSVTLTCQKGNLQSGTVYLWYLDEVNGNQLIGPYTMN